MNLMKRSVSVLLLCGALMVPAMAQDEIDKLLRESVDDAEKLVGAYVSPMMKAMSLGLNQGWYNTAAPHKVAGIDITFTANLMAIPDDELWYNVANLGLQHIDLDEASPGEPGHAPTILGDDIEPIFHLKDDPSQTFTGPPGLDIRKVPTGRLPVPIAHLGFGLPKGFDVKVRYAPTLDLGNESSLKLFGIGVMHDVKQWIPGIKLLPFDLSGFIGFTKLDINTALDAQDNPDQQGIFKINATTVQGVISKKFSVATIYGGVGYNIAKSNLALKGTYDLGDGTEVKDPIDLSFAASGPRVTAGFRLKLAVLTLHADYTMQKYNSLTVGLGVSVR